MRKAVAIIQARMGSSRLPGKVLMEVEGRPLLWYQLERLKRCDMISRIIVATSESAADDAIKTFCEKNNFEFFRGNENDVLDRYYQCARAYKAEVIIRITADCPLLDPKLTGEVVDFFQNNPGFDLVVTGPAFPEGFDAEVLPFTSLETAWKEAKLKSEREHVTSFLWKNDSRFKIKTLSLDKDYSFLRLTVDEAADFEVVSVVIKELYNKKGIGFSFKDILCLYGEKPEVFEKNKHIIRNEGYLNSIKGDYI